MDYCGVVDFDGTRGNCRWLWKIPMGVDRVGPNKEAMLARIRQMTPGDMPDFDTSMRLALDGLMSRTINPSMRHLIIISDGDPSPPSNSLINKFVQQGIKISTVAIGFHTTPQTLQDIAKKTGGHYYIVLNKGSALPKIFQREARRVAKQLIKESPDGMPVAPTQAALSHLSLTGIDVQHLAPITGFVMTSKKENSLVETLLEVSLENFDRDNSTVLATWQYGAGRVTALTTDFGLRWASGWFQADYYDKLYSQIVRYSMRPAKNEGDFLVATEVVNGRGKVVVTAMNDQGQLLDFLRIAGRGVDPDTEGFDLNFEQFAPGRYIAEFDAKQPGSYLFSMFPGQNFQRLLGGVNVPFSSEYNDRQTNKALLADLASTRPVGAPAGEVVQPDLAPDSLDQLLAYDPFRSSLTTAFAAKDIWPWLLVAFAALFVADVGVRRLALRFEWPRAVFAAIVRRLRRRDEAAEATEQNVARLQARKREVQRQLQMQAEAPDELAPRLGGGYRGPAIGDYIKGVVADPGRAQEAQNRRVH